MSASWPIGGVSATPIGLSACSGCVKSNTISNQSTFTTFTTEVLAWFNFGSSQQCPGNELVNLQVNTGLAAWPQLHFISLIAYSFHHSSAVR